MHQGTDIPILCSNIHKVLPGMYISCLYPLLFDVLMNLLNRYSMYFLPLLGYEHIFSLNIIIYIRVNTIKRWNIYIYIGDFNR